MFIETFILNCDNCMLQINRYLIESDRQSVGIRSSQFTDLIPCIIVEKGCIAQWHNINIINIRSSINYTPE